jgi:hypothetical protein
MSRANIAGDGTMIESCKSNMVDIDILTDWIKFSMQEAMQQVEGSPQDWTLHAQMLKVRAKLIRVFASCMGPESEHVESVKASLAEFRSCPDCE